MVTTGIGGLYVQNTCLPQDSSKKKKEKSKVSKKEKENGRKDVFTIPQWSNQPFGLSHNVVGVLAVRLIEASM